MGNYSLIEHLKACEKRPRLAGDKEEAEAHTDIISQLEQEEPRLSVSAVEGESYGT